MVKCIRYVAIYKVIKNINVQIKLSRNDLKKAVRGDFSSLHVPCYTPETSFLSVQIPSPTEILVAITYVILLDYVL